MRILFFLFMLPFMISLAACKKEAESNSGNISLSTTDTVVYSGSFVSNAHTTTGNAKIIKSKDGKRYLILENISTDAGPDVRVFVAPDRMIGGATEILKPSKNGNTKVEIPNSVNLTAQKFVLIWCQQASVLFGNAPLN